MNYQLTGRLIGLCLCSASLVAAAEQAAPAGNAGKGSVIAELKQQGANPVQLAMRDGNRQPTSSLKAVIDLGDQEMRVYLDGGHEHTWPVSTARAGYTTPNGTYKAQWLSRMHYSKKYDDAPMPYSVFFSDGYAIHGTDSISRLGRPASHGCIRLHPDNAKILFDLVNRVGKSNSTIQIVGDPPVRKVPPSYRQEDGRLNHRPIYEEDRSVPPSQRNKRPSSGSDSPGFNRASSFGTIPSIF